MIFKTIDGELSIFNQKLTKTKNNIDTITKSVSYYSTQNGQRISLQNVGIVQTQQVGTLTKLNNAFDVYNNKLSGTIEGQQKYANTISSINPQLGNYLANLNGAQASMGGYIVSLAKAKLATIGLQAASIALNMALTMGISLIIQGLIKGIDYLIHAEEKQREKLEEAKSAYQELESQLQSVQDELKTTTDRINELNAKDNLTFVEQEELNRLKETNNELQRQQDLLDNEKKIAQSEANKEFVKTMDKDVNSPTEYQKPFAGGDMLKRWSASWWLANISSGGQAGEYVDESVYIEEQFARYEQLKDQLTQASTTKERKRIQKQIDEIESYLKEKSQQWVEDSDGIEYIKNPTKEDERKVNEWLDYINDFRDRMAIATGGDNAKTNALTRILDKDEFSDIKKQLEDLGKSGELTGEKVKELIPVTSELYQKLVDLGVISKDDTDWFDGLANMFNDTGKKANDASSATTSALKELNEALDKLQSAYQSVQSAIEEYNKTGYLSVDTFQSLMELEPKYLNMLLDENGNLNLNTTAIQKNTAAYIENMGIKAAQNLIDSVSALPGATAQMEYLTGVTNENTKATWANIYAQLAKAKAVSDPAVIDALYTRINAIQQMTESAKAGIGKGGLGKSASDTASKIDDVNEKLDKLDKEQHLSDLKYSIETITQELEKFEQALDRLDSKLDLTFENDFTSKFQIVGQQFLQASRYGGEMRNELERLLAIEPQTADEANELASRLESLSNSFFENEKQILEYRDTMYQTILDFASASAEHEVEKADNVKDILDNTYSILENGSLSGGFWSRSLLPSVSKDKVKQQRAENNKLIAEEERYQNAIADIRKKATDMAKAEEDKERAKQREEYLQDLANAQNDYNSAILNTTEISTNSTDTIKDGVDGVSDSLDTATQKANEFGEAMSNAGRTQVMSPLTSEDIKSGDYEVEGETTKVVLNKDSESNLIDTTASYKGTPIKALYNAASKSYGFYVFDSTSNAYRAFVPKGTIQGLDGNFLHAQGGMATGVNIVNEGTGALAGREGYIGKDNKLHWFKDEKNLMFNTDDVVQVISAPDMANIIKYTGMKYFTEPIGNISSVSSYANGNTNVSFSPIPYNTMSDSIINKNINIDSATQQIIDEINKSFENTKDNISFDSLKKAFYDNLTDKSFYTELSKGIANMTEGSIDDSDNNVSKALKGLILQNSAWDDLPDELQKKYAELGANSDNWSDWASNSDNALQAFNLMEGAGVSSWDLLDQNIIALLQEYGIDGKEAWDTFIQENPLQALQLLTSSWNALETLIQQYIDDMTTIAINGANAIHAIQIEAPGISTESWNNLQTLIANKIQEVLNVINETFGANTVDLNFSINTSLAGNSQTNPQGVSGGNNAVVNTAKQFLGVPYVWGGTSPSGFDCSGLMQYAFAQNNVQIPRTADEQWKQAGTQVAKNNLQPGDMVFFDTEGGNYASHVGMYMGNGQFIHAPKPGDVVKISDLNSDYYTSHYLGAKRVPVNSYASGTQGAKAGYAEIAEEYRLKGLNHYTPEIVIKKNTGKAYLAGLNGSEIWNLDQGDTVLPYNVTKELLEQSGTKVNGYAKGTPNAFSFTKNLFNNKSKNQSASNNTSNSVQQQTTNGTRIDVPDGLGKYTTYMEWYKVTDKSSLQYKLRNDTGENYTPEGFGVVNGRLVLAMTSTFGGIGDYVDIHLSDGRVIQGIIGDEKSQQYVPWDHNPANQWGHENGQVIIEYVVQKGWNKGNPSLGGASVDYVENLGNYWGNPTFSGGATGTMFFNPYLAKYNEVLEKLKTLMGVFKTNTHTVTPKVSPIKSLGSSRKNSYDFDVPFTQREKGGIAPSGTIVQANEHNRPEATIDENGNIVPLGDGTSQIFVSDKPFPVINANDYAKIKQYGGDKKPVSFLEKGNTSVSVETNKDKTEVSAEDKEYAEQLEKLNAHMAEGNKLTKENSKYTLEELKTINGSLGEVEDSDNITIDKLDGILTYSESFADMEEWVEKELPKLLETYNQKYYERYSEEQKRYLDFQKGFTTKLEDFSKNATEGNYMERYMALIAESNAETTRTITTQTEMAAESIRTSLDVIKEQREKATQVWQDAPTATLQEQALETLKDIVDAEDQLNEEYANIMQELSDHIVSSIENADLGFKSRLSFIEKDNEKLDRLINRTDDAAEIAKLTQEKIENNNRAIEILNERQVAAHQSVMDNIYNSDNPNYQKVLELIKFEEAFDANGEFNDVYYDNIDVLINAGYSDLIADYKTMMEIGKVNKQIWVEAGESRNDYLDNGMDLALEQANAKIELQVQVYDKINERLDLRLNKEKAITSALEQQNSFQQSLRDTALDYESELIANKHLEDYLDKQAKELLFNDNDYEEMIDTIDSISAEATRKYKEYQSAISKLGDEDYYKEQKLTEEYNQQMEILQEQLEEAKQKLEVTKKQTEYNNTLKERDTRVILGGRSIQIADPDKLYNIELERSKAEKQLDNLIQDNAENQKVRNMELESAVTQEIISANEKYVDTLQNLDDNEKIRHAETMASTEELTASLHALSTDYIPFLNNYEYNFRTQMAGLSDIEWGNGYDYNYDHAEGQRRFWDMLYEAGIITYEHYIAMSKRNESQRNNKVTSDPVNSIYSPQTTQYGGKTYKDSFAISGDKAVADYKRQFEVVDYKTILDVIAKSRDEHGGYLTADESKQAFYAETMLNRDLFNNGQHDQQTSDWGGIKFGETDKGTLLQSSQKMRQFCEENGGLTDLEERTLSITEYYGKLESEILNNQALTTEEINSKLDELNNNLLGALSTIGRQDTSNTSVSKDNSPLPAIGSIAPAAAMLPHYASGTKSAKGGVAITDEDGYEAKLRELTGGKYTLLKEEDMIFNKAATDNLWDFANNPQNFLSEQLSKMNSQMLSQIQNISNNNDNSTSIQNTFSGDIVVSQTVENANELFSDAFRQASSRYDITKNMKQ